MEEHTTFVENLVKDILVNVGKIEPALATNGLINRGSYYDGTKILHPDEYDYHPILALSQYITDVTNASERHEDDGKRKIRINVNKLPNPLPPKCLGTINENGEAEFKTNELLYMLSATISAALEHMETQGTVKLNPRFKQYRRNEIQNTGMHGPAVRLRVGAPLGTTDIDLCFCLKLEPHELGPSVHIINTEHIPFGFWTESVVELPNSDEYKLTPPHRKLFLTLKYVSNLTRLLGSQCRISSYALRTLIIHHQQDCRASNLGECFISIIDKLMTKSDEERNSDFHDDEYNYDEEFIYLYDSNGWGIQNTIFPGKSFPLHGVRIHLLISMVWIIQHIKLNRSNNWWNVFLSNNVTEIRRNRILQTLMDGLNKYNKFDQSRNASKYLRLEWQHDDKNSVVMIQRVLFPFVPFVSSVN
ncbi:unnamed protein product [Owenia fusiformis]|uniref:Mab-21-like nucleotidyltransferase domain-containing protein n=1 Tax=Owenia fusiformis TaxID=6347 RepID=A0A8S4Q9H4_OWEFU|nr:unnamed protein product [Owenia fusiformis]